MASFNEESEEQNSRKRRDVLKINRATKYYLLRNLQDTIIDDMMQNIKRIDEKEADTFIKSINAITTNNAELNKRLIDMKNEVEVIKESIKDSRTKIDNESAKRLKQNYDAAVKDDSIKVLEKIYDDLKKNYDAAVRIHQDNHKSLEDIIDSLINLEENYTATANSNEGVSVQSNQGLGLVYALPENMEFSVEDFQLGEFLRIKKELLSIQNQNRLEFQEFSQELKDLNPKIFEGLDKSLEELEKTVVEPMNQDDTNLPSEITKIGGRRTKKRRNMRRNSKRKKLMRKKSMRKKSMRKKSMRRRRSSKKKY